MSSEGPARPWRVWVDTGGTFTDCLAVPPDGSPLRRVKVLSSACLRARVTGVVGERRLVVGGIAGLAPGPLPGWRLRSLDGSDAVGALAWEEGGVVELEGAPPAGLAAGALCELASPEEAPVLACRLVTGTPAAAPLPPLELRLATTLGTNALLERRGAPTAIFLTRGFADLLEIGTQQRPDLFALDVRKPASLYRLALEVEERLGARGEMLLELDLAALRDAARGARAAGAEAAAVALLHSYRHPEHERLAAEELRAAGFAHVSASAELAPAQGYLARAETALVDAYLGPILARYLARIAAAVTPDGSRRAGRSILVMNSAGGLVAAERFRPHEGLLSGPAAGVVGAAAASRRSGVARAIAFDMGGTSTDVARWEGELPWVHEHRVGDARLLAPAVAVETVAAGGGSICAFDGHALRVGPQSAGSRPGPAAYGAGGPLCLTDVNLLLGRIDPARFEIPLDIAAAERAFAALAASLAAADQAIEREELLAGLLRIADERMAEAIREISVRQGYDPARYALIAFGGAGGQHACAVAELLGIARVLLPPDASLLSALGLGAARIERVVSRQVLEPLDAVAGDLDAWLGEIAVEACARVEREGVPPGDVTVERRTVELRWLGQESAVEIRWPEEGEDLLEAFGRRYRELFGYLPWGRRAEVVALRVAAAGPGGEPPAPGRADVHAPAAVPATRLAWFGGWRQVPVFERERIPAGSRVEGPALVVEPHTVCVVAQGWGAEVDGSGALVLRRGPANAAAAAERSAPVPVRTAASPSRAAAVELELFTHRFASLARAMGEALRRTAVSTNVKERLDFSCGVLDPEGRLVVNAPHIPVHLGALGLCVRAVARALPLGPGEVAVTNHPAFGGSHLPDVTVVTPVHERPDGGELLGWVASRAHHAELGGRRPGSMPPDARTLAEEGVVIAPRHLVRGGEALWGEVETLLRSGPWPSRRVDENLADLAAAVAANHHGAATLRALAGEHGRDRVAWAMAALRERAAGQVRAALESLGEARREAEERLDDGSPLRVALELAGGRLRVDFAGSAAVHPGNLNATTAVVRSAVLYVLRLLVGAAAARGGVRETPVPLNEGLLEPVDLLVPPGSLLDPPFPDDPALAPAVVGGNVETSQRVVDTLLKALGLAACSQGTMNNVLFGDERIGYYETVCGGCGAGPGFDGASAVHSHMTNTRITDPEVLEHRYPVRVERFAVRRGSGGAGRWRGGDGAIREILFLAPLALSVLTQHRAAGPYGVAGGQPGKPGRQRVLRADGGEELLGSVDGREVRPGDRLVLETPGGGGWG